MGARALASSEQQRIMDANSAAAQQLQQARDNRMRSLSLSLPWRRPKSTTLSHAAADMPELPQQLLYDVAVEDDDPLAANEPSRSHLRRLSHGQSPHSYQQHQQHQQHQHHPGSGFKGIFRRASVSIRGIVHRRPSLAAPNDTLGDSDADVARPITGRPLTSYPAWNRSRSSSNRHAVRPSRSFYGLNTTHEPTAMPPLPQQPQPQPQPQSQPQDVSPLYSPRPGVDGEPPVIPYNTGAAAKASAAIQNEYLARQGLQNRRLQHPSAANNGLGLDNNDDESGVGIAVSVPEAAKEDAQISRLDFITKLPTELAIHILGNLDAAALAKASLVSRDWGGVVSSQHVWRESCLRETTRTYAMSGPIRPNVGLGLPRSSPTSDWRHIYRITKELQQRWRKGTARPTYLNGHTDSIYCLQFDEHKIITGSRDRTIRVWDMHTLQCRLVIGPAGIVQGSDMVRDRNGDSVHYASDSDGRKTATSVPTALSFDEHHDASILCLQYDDTMLATGSSDSTCILYDMRDGYKPVRRLRHHTAAILDLAFDDKHIVTCSKDVSICVWDRATGQLLRQLRGHTGPVNAVQMRGNTIVSCSGDFKVKLWNIDTGKNIREFVGHTKGLACSQFSEDGRYVASAGNDKMIRVWDANTGELLWEKKAHDNLVRSLHIDSVSGRLVSGSYDTDIKVWDMETGDQLLEFPQWHASWVLSAKSDYRRIVSTGQDPKILIMDFGADIDGVEMLESRDTNAMGGGFI
ncbi:F-box and WD-40 domain protein 1/11 [Geosmithia morbida]|uniref:F-box and WD-40 domain protein 1/11 n=1 Tax=Geosmithia morbida TaxID=1094350 RepID=A0A9P4YP83_9HYPO|nr:F-box and WD-40 domain protein 1/11 [Geosmithia morbida]KAF4119287.1 F-box and WD-40 domain protein 1/11 [Geosmithia morbida]